MVAKYGGERVPAGDLRPGDVLTFAHLTVQSVQASEDGTHVRAVCLRGTDVIVRLWTKQTPLIIKTRSEKTP